MQETNSLELKNEERTRGEIWVSQNRLPSGQTQSGERPAGMADRRDAPGMDTTSILDNEERTRCEIWTRVMGYHRPVSAWNAGKQSEHRERRYFTESRAPS